jgi:hypothetical protein
MNNLMMRKFGNRWIVVLSVFIFYIVACNNIKEGESDGLTQALEDFRVALLDPTEQQLRALTSAQLSYGHSSGKLETQDEFVATLLSGRSDFVELHFSDESVISKGSTAVVRHRLDAVTNDAGQPGTVSLQVMLVWIKENGTWKLLARQAVKPPVK